MIERSSLPERVKERSAAVFRAIAEAEGRIHGMPPEQVHFHEVGAMDSIIDIIGVCIALDILDIDTIIASPVPTGYGRMKMAHGLYPIPAPATLELLKGIPLSGLQAEGELTTPTGAGILKALASGFGPIPAVRIERIGYGAGKKDFPHPNVIRALLIAGPDQEHREASHGEQETVETVEVLEAQLDDFTGEQFGFLLERLLNSGALDVYFTPVYMKKNRPGTLVTVIARPSQAQVAERIFDVRRAAEQLVAESARAQMGRSGDGVRPRPRETGASFGNCRSFRARIRRCGAGRQGASGADCEGVRRSDPQDAGPDRQRLTISPIDNESKAI